MPLWAQGRLVNTVGRCGQFRDRSQLCGTYTLGSTWRFFLVRASSCLGTIYGISSQGRGDGSNGDNGNGGGGRRETGHRTSRAHRNKKTKRNATTVGRSRTCWRENTRRQRLAVRGGLWRRMTRTPVSVDRRQWQRRTRRTGVEKSKAAAAAGALVVKRPCDKSKAAQLTANCGRGMIGRVTTVSLMITTNSRQCVYTFSFTRIFERMHRHTRSHVTRRTRDGARRRPWQLQLPSAAANIYCYLDKARLRSRCPVADRDDC